MGCGCAKKKKANQKPQIRDSSARSNVKNLPIITIRRNNKSIKKKS
jgi:hypothetical protein